MVFGVRHRRHLYLFFCTPTCGVLKLDLTTFCSFATTTTITTTFYLFYFNFFFFSTSSLSYGSKKRIKGHASAVVWFIPSPRYANYINPRHRGRTKWRERTTAEHPGVELEHFAQVARKYKVLKRKRDGANMS